MRPFVVGVQYYAIRTPQRAGDVTNRLSHRGMTRCGQLLALRSRLKKSMTTSSRKSVEIF